MTADEVLGRCEALRDGNIAAGESDLAWLIGCFEHPIRAVRRTAGDAVVALARSGHAVRLALHRAMGPGPFERRWVAAWIWSRIFEEGDDVARGVLVEALGVDDGDIRWAAARALTSAPGDGVSMRLRTVAAEGNAEQRKMAIYCLRDLGSRDTQAIELFRSALSDAAPGVRLAAMNALARTEPTRDSARRIARLIDDPDGGVRRAAVATVSRVGVDDPEVIEALRICAVSDDAILARGAAAALARLR